MSFSSQVMIGLDGNNHAVFADLSEAEFFWVGQMTCSWAMLENLMMGITKDAAAFYEQSLPDNFETLPFKKRFTLFQEMIVHIKPEEVRKPLENVVGRIAACKKNAMILLMGRGNGITNRRIRLRSIMPERRDTKIKTMMLTASER
jgi:hypothetical protein